MIGQFMEVGFRHIVSVEALDHLLFLAALAASYRPRDWRHGFAVVSAFTVGHSITLALAALGIVSFPTAIVEFLIPCTIVIAGAENLLHRQPRPSGWLRPALAGVFGLVHGAGFASTLSELLTGNVALPLLGFNVGIELGQMLVLASLVSCLTLADRMLLPIVRGGSDAMRWRVSLTSVAVAGMAFFMAVERAPW